MQILITITIRFHHTIILISLFRKVKYSMALSLLQGDDCMLQVPFFIQCSLCTMRPFLAFFLQAGHTNAVGEGCDIIFWLRVSSSACDLSFSFIVTHFLIVTFLTPQSVSSLTLPLLYTDVCSLRSATLSHCLQQSKILVFVHIMIFNTFLSTSAQYSHNYK